VAHQSGQLGIYKVHDNATYDLVAANRFSLQQGGHYWLYLTETRVDNDPSKAVTIYGELRNTDLEVLGTIEVTDNGNLAGHPRVPGSDVRGIGGYFSADGNGVKVFEWHVESPDGSEPLPPAELEVVYNAATISFTVEANWDTEIHARQRYKKEPWSAWELYEGAVPILYQGNGKYRMHARARNPAPGNKWVKDKSTVKLQ